MAWPPIPRPQNAVRKRAWRIGDTSQASSTPRPDEVQGIEIAKKRTLSSLRGISIRYCAERTCIRSGAKGCGEGRPEAPTFPPEATFLIYL